MRAVREFPPNPHVVVFHTESRLTEEIVETYLVRSPGTARGWIRRALDLPGLRVLSLNAYRIRVQKQKRARWRPLLDPFEQLLREELGIEGICDLIEEECRRRRFAWHGESLDRRVFEGRLQARSCPVAGKLFRLHGVAEVIIEGHEVEVRKCPLASWRELAPEVERILEAAREDVADVP